MEKLEDAAEIFRSDRAKAKNAIAMDTIINHEISR